MNFNLLYKIKQIYLKKKYKLNRVGRRTRIKNSFFEGNNAVFDDAEVVCSFVGLGSYVGRKSSIENVKIGRFCSIADHVYVCLGRHPVSEFVSTFPAFYYNTNRQLGFTFHREQPAFETSKFVENGYNVVVGNDVWIGSHVLILAGVTIGDGSMIAAGSVVVKDVEPYSIVGGVPAHHIKYRFDEATRKKLEMSKWWNMPIDSIQKKCRDFLNVDFFVNKYGTDDLNSKDVV